jgi:hypothetical protein
MAISWKCKRRVSFKDSHGLHKPVVLLVLFKCKFGCVLLHFDFESRKFQKSHCKSLRYIDVPPHRKVFFVLVHLNSSAKVCTFVAPTASSSTTIFVRFQVAEVLCLKAFALKIIAQKLLNFRLFLKASLSLQKLYGLEYKMTGSIAILWRRRRQLLWSATAVSQYFLPSSIQIMTCGG